MKVWVHVAVMAAISLFSIEAGAHAKVIESTPAADATITEAPKEIVLVFKSPVRVTSLFIEQAGKPKQALGPLPTADSARITIAAPNLSPGEYSITWSAAGQDGHAGTGTIKFTLTAR